MKISIITVCYNSDRFISDAIDSVDHQNYGNIEYIVIDGFSTDRTMDIVAKSYNQGAISKYLSEKDFGIYDAMNKGIQQSEGDIIGILNSDDFYPDDDVIDLVAQKFSQNPDLDILFGAVKFVDRKTNKVRRKYSSKSFFPWMLKFGLMPPHPASFIRKSVYDREGLYKINYKIAADFEFFSRVYYSNKYCYESIDDVLVYMRTGGVSTSGLNYNLLSTREMLRAFNDNGLKTNYLFLSFRFIIKLIQLFKK